MFTVYAHRGSSGTYPEHTRAAYLHALAEGADGIETDVHLTADDVLVCFHDSTVDRTSSGSGPISGMTLAEIRALDVVSWAGATVPEQYGSSREQVVTLEELITMMRRVPRELGLAIELKHPSPFGRRLEEKVLALLMELGWDPETSRIGNVRISLMSFDPAAIDYLLETIPGYHLCMLVTVLEQEQQSGLGLITRNAIRYVMGRIHGGAMERLDSGAVGLAGPGVAYARKYPERVGSWLERGLRGRAWTVNTVEDAQFLADLGFTEFTSDFPALIKGYLENKLEACS
ncbi:glycerophosphodiester phosphodiesterase [Zhihengliuella alba]|uniref:Glycerophosphodiester phosphodiesterase n=1 Tax=Zhihengliuella alba TaxID=547018 RepID=A0ABP7DZE8_9MICC